VLAITFVLVVAVFFQILTKSIFADVLPAKKRYFFGLRVHPLITANGDPVEFVLTVLMQTSKRSNSYLLSSSIIYADRGYTDYQEGYLLRESRGITLFAQCKKNSKMTTSTMEEYLAHPIRKYAETTF